MMEMVLCPDMRGEGHTPMTLQNQEVSLHNQYYSPDIRYIIIVEQLTNFIDLGEERKLHV